jgi:choline kinase
LPNDGRPIARGPGDVDTAIILAAGMGTRFQGLDDGLPKGLLPLCGEPILARSLRLLRSVGILRFLIVVGHGKDAYARFAATRPDVRLIANDAYAETGTMASLMCALHEVDHDFLLLESDLVYERRALDAVIARGRADVILGSGPTGAGDEVWLQADAGRLVSMSKNRSALTNVDGELVGIHRMSAALGAELASCFGEFRAEHHHGRMSYETDALATVAQRRSIPVHIIPDLLWGEIDDRQQYLRVRDRVLPEIRRRETSNGGGEL